MKMFNSCHTLLLLVIALALSFSVPLKAQNTAEDYLNAHNRARAAEGVGPLIWSPRLARYALDYAGQRLDCRPKFSGGPFGEALVSYPTARLSANEAVGIWVKQKFDYSYATNTCRPGRSCTGYLQVVWKNTVSVGCAKVNCINGGSFTICSYDPSGNIAGERPF